ncbi:hypothetical protein D9M71_841230 [compost metagenome]
MIKVVLGLLFLLFVGTDITEVVFSGSTDKEEEVIHGLRHFVQGRVDVTLNQQRVIETILQTGVRVIVHKLDEACHLLTKVRRDVVVPRAMRSLVEQAIQSRG